MHPVRKIRSFHGIGVIAASLLFAASAQASMLSASSGETTMYESTALVGAPTITVTQLDFASAGVLNVTLKDLAWPDLAQALSFSLSDATSVLQKINTSGPTPSLLTFDISGPMTLFASVYAAPKASTRAALYYLNIGFTPTASPVPLPAGVWLLISGLAGLGVAARKRRDRHTAVTHA